MQEEEDILPDVDAEPAIERDMHELMRLLPRLIRRLRESPESAVLEPFRRAAHDAGLGNRHRRVLLSLAMDGQATVGELASRIALAPATTSLLVNELHRARLVERLEDSADRRRIIVQLPEEYRRVIETWAQSRVRTFRRTLESLEPQARAHFLEGLRLLTEASGNDDQDSTGATPVLPVVDPTPPVS